MMAYALYNGFREHPEDIVKKNIRPSAEGQRIHLDLADAHYKEAEKRAGFYRDESEHRYVVSNACGSPEGVEVQVEAKITPPGEGQTTRLITLTYCVWDKDGGAGRVMQGNDEATKFTEVYTPSGWFSRQ